MLPLSAQRTKLWPPLLSAWSSGVFTSPYFTSAKRPQVCNEMHALSRDHLQWCLWVATGWQLWVSFSEDVGSGVSWQLSFVLCHSPHLCVFHFLSWSFLSFFAFKAGQVSFWGSSLSGSWVSFIDQAPEVPETCGKWMWHAKPVPESTVRLLALHVPALPRQNASSQHGFVGGFMDCT